MTWFRGNLHTHSTLGSGDGRSSPEEHRCWYQGHGYDFLAITDHDNVTRCPQPAGGSFCFIEHGVEYSGNHLVALGVETRLDWRLPAELLQGITDEGGLAVAAHPNWNTDHWPQSLLRDLPGLTALEIYNSHGEELAGSPFAVERWDDLLTQGGLLWGIASDDAHAAEGPVAGRGWVMVWAEGLAPASLIAGLRAGQFYACKGLEFALLGLSDRWLDVSVPGAESIRLAGPGGQSLEQSSGETARFAWPSPAPYTRVEARRDDAWVWSQPLTFRGSLTPFGQLAAEGHLG